MNILISTNNIVYIVPRRLVCHRKVAIVLRMPDLQHQSTRSGPKPGRLSLTADLGHDAIADQLHRTPKGTQSECDTPNWSYDRAVSTE